MCLKVTAAREALATLKPQAGGVTPSHHTPAHHGAAPPTPTHAETPVHSQAAVEETGREIRPLNWLIG